MNLVVVELSTDKALEAEDSVNDTCRLAGSPTRHSVKATTKGVLRTPSEFSIARDTLSSMIETQESINRAN